MKLVRKRPGMRDHRSRQFGFSVVEVMVALVIGLIITVAVAQIFSSSHSTAQLDEGLARLQENGRFATDFLTNEIRQAGYFGCVSGAGPLRARVSNYLVGGNVPGSPFDISTPIMGFEFTGTATVPGSTVVIPPTGVTSSTSWTPALTPLLTSVAPGPIAGSDVVLIRSVEGPSFKTVPASSTTTAITVVTPNDLRDGDILMAGNCIRTSLFQANIAAGTPGTILHPKATSGGPLPGNICTTWGLTDCPTSDDIGSSTSPVPEVSRFNVTAFFIGQRAGNDVPSLYRARWTSTGAVPEELVEGVENMQALYGVDTNGDGNADGYLPASSVTDWSNVVSVQIALLVRTITTTTSGGQVRSNAEQTADTNTYVLAGTNVTVNSSLRPLNRRRVFDTVIKLRNRGGA